MVLSNSWKGSDFICFILITFYLRFCSYHLKHMFSNQFLVIDSIKNIFHQFLWSTIERVYLLCYWFCNIFNKSEKKTQYIQLDSTIFLRSNLIQYFNSSNIIILFIYFCYYLFYHFRRGPAQDVPFLYMQSHLSELKGCESIISTNFTFIFIYK